MHRPLTHRPPAGTPAPTAAGPPDGAWRSPPSFSAFSFSGRLRLAISSGSSWDIRFPTRRRRLLRTISPGFRRVSGDARISLRPATSRSRNIADASSSASRQSAAASTTKRAASPNSWRNSSGRRTARSSTPSWRGAVPPRRPDETYLRGPRHLGYVLREPAPRWRAASLCRRALRPSRRRGPSRQGQCHEAGILAPRRRTPDVATSPPAPPPLWLRARRACDVTRITPSRKAAEPERQMDDQGSVAREPLGPKETTMSKSETGKIENGHTARVLRDDELDLVSGGLELENCLISNFMAPRRADFIVAS